MGWRSTNNSLQTAPVYQIAGGKSGSGTSTWHSGTTLDDLPPTASPVVSGGDPSRTSLRGWRHLPFFPRPGLSLPEPLERSHAVSVADPENPPPFFLQSLARV